jgi:type II secretory pathway pseudopilin PulG
LLEILVALAILGLAFAGIFGSFQSGAKQMRAAEAATLRVLEARSIIDGAVASPELVAGERTGTMVDGAAWHLEVSPVVSATEQAPAGSAGAYDIVLTVTERDRTVLSLRTLAIGR